jgi:flagellar basal-body rod modification protein FlgD
MTTAVSNNNNSTASTNSTSSSSLNDTSSTATADRFLKLLVAQMQNQDPLSPMDNAQVTTQMAQINTVTGIDSLNTTVKSLGTQFTQMQALQGAALIGKDVIVEGNKLSVTDKTGQGGFSLDTPADKVSVDIINKAGKVVGTQDLGALDAGQHGFEWDLGSNDATADYTFKVTASASGTALTPTPLMRDTVNAINTSGDSLTLELAKSGKVPYVDVKALN